jgi:isocitrate dehydrogenase
MGNVANVGLMAQKAEEYGSHDKTFEMKSQGVVMVRDKNSGEVCKQAVGIEFVWHKFDADQFVPLSF